MAHTLLLVEDNEPLRSGYARLLADRGYEVTAVATRHQGARAAQKLAPDIVLTDTQLRDPAFDDKVFWGFELASYLRRHRYGGVIIGMSADSAQHILPGQAKTLAELYENAGADAFIEKADLVKDLESAIQKAFAAHSS